MTVIGPMAAAEREGFRACVAAVSQERRFLTSETGFSADQLDGFLARLAARGLTPILARDGGTVIGWCDLDPHEGLQAHVATLGMGLMPAWRGRGIGARLLEAALTMARAAGFARIELQVLGQNAPARALYRRFGFKEEGVKRRACRTAYGEDDAICMALLLDEADQPSG